MSEKYIAYYRVSTKKQGLSGLGLEAQKEILKSYNIISEFTEVESGKNTNRMQLNLAIAECKRLDATLLVAKLDRLSRNAAFTLALIDSGIKILFADMPNIDIISLATLSAVAQKEAETISNRIKLALKAREARGLSNDRSSNITTKQRSRGGKKSGLIRAEQNKIKTLQAFKLARILRDDKKGYRKIAQNLNDVGLKTVRDKLFTATAVKNLLKLHGYKGG